MKENDTEKEISKPPKKLKALSSYNVFAREYMKSEGALLLFIFILFFCL